MSNTGLCFFARVTDDSTVLYGWTFTEANCTGTYALINASEVAWDY